MFYVSRVLLTNYYEPLYMLRISEIPRKESRGPVGGKVSAATAPAPRGMHLLLAAEIGHSTWVPKLYSRAGSKK